MKLTIMAFAIRSLFSPPIYYTVNNSRTIGKSAKAINGMGWVSHPNVLYAKTPTLGF